MSPGELFFWMLFAPVIVAFGLCLWFKVLAVLIPVVVVSLIVIGIVAGIIAWLVNAFPRRHGPAAPAPLPPGAGPHPAAFRMARPRRARRPGP